MLDPGFAAAAFSLAVAQRLGGSSAAGEALLRALVERRPREPEPLLHLARFLSSAGEPERALDAYELALGRFPTSLPLRVAFAQELAAWGRTADALQHLEIARRQLPREPRLGLLVGRTLASEGRLDAAAAQLSGAARGLAGAGRGEAWYWLMAVRRLANQSYFMLAIAEKIGRLIQTPIQPSPGSARNTSATAAARAAHRRRLRQYQRLASAAAVIGICAGGAWLLWPNARPTTADLAALPGDADGDGRVDMLDALIVGNGLERGVADRAWDINRDGVVDRADVRLIAFAAVSLERRESHP